MRSRTVIFVVVAVLTLSGGGWALWENVISDRVYPRNWAEVEPGRLYRSGRLSANLAERTLAEHHIKAIVALIDDNPRRPDSVEMKAAADRLGIERTIVSMDGNGIGTPAKYATALVAVDRAIKAGKPVLVHCKAGAQRTGGVIATYQVLVEGIAPAEAYRQLTSHGHDPDDNPGLVPWLNANMGAIAALLVERGVIARMPDVVPVLRP